jgi:hypothetical protein
VHRGSRQSRSATASAESHPAASCPQPVRVCPQEDEHRPPAGVHSRRTCSQLASLPLDRSRDCLLHQQAVQPPAAVDYRPMHRQAAVGLEREWLLAGHLPGGRTGCRRRAAPNHPSGMKQVVSSQWDG